MINVSDGENRCSTNDVDDDDDEYDDDDDDNETL